MFKFITVCLMTFAIAATEASNVPSLPTFRYAGLVGPYAATGHAAQFLTPHQPQAVYGSVPVAAAATYNVDPSAYHAQPFIATAYHGRPLAATAYHARPLAATAYHTRPFAGAAAYHAGPIHAAAYHAGPVHAAYHSGSPVHATYASSPIIAPYGSTYNAHHIAHSAAYAAEFAAPETSFEGVTVAAAYQAAPVATAEEYEYGHVVDAAPGPAKYIL